MKFLARASKVSGTIVVGPKISRLLGFTVVAIHCLNQHDYGCGVFIYWIDNIDFFFYFFSLFLSFFTPSSLTKMWIWQDSEKKIPKGKCNIWKYDISKPPNLLYWNSKIILPKFNRQHMTVVTVKWRCLRYFMIQLQSE